MANKFADLSEEELMEVLKQGNFDESEMPELLKAMEEKGLKGVIMPVTEMDSPEAEAMRGYIEYHKKIKTFWSKPEVDEFIEILLKTGAEIEDKRKALVSLAHIPKPEAFEALKKYSQEPDEALKIWSQMALQECRAFLEADILEEDRISVASLAGGERGRLRFYFVLLAKNLTHWLPGDEKRMADVVAEIAAEKDWEIEETEAGEYYFIITALHTIEQSPRDLINLIMDNLNLNEDQMMTQEYALCTNTHKPTKEEIGKWREDLKNNLKQ
jgi:hypothetical protein